MSRDEAIRKIIIRTSEAFPGISIDRMREIIEAVIYDYDVIPKERALARIGDMPDKIDLYLASKRLDGLSELTLYNYKIHLQRLDAFVRKDIKDIDAMDIRRFLAAYLTRSKAAKSTMSTVVSTIKSFFSWLVDQEYLERSPMRAIKAAKPPMHLRTAMTVEEVELFRTGCQDDRERALTEFFLSSGCRVSEVVQINIGDIDWQTCSVVVHGKGDKYRTVNFSPKAKLYLNKYLRSRPDASPADPLFVSNRRPYQRLTRSGVGKIIDRIAETAGMGRKVHPHLFRHTMTTLSLRQGADLLTVSGWLGHSSLNTTSRYSTTSPELSKYKHSQYVTF